MKSKTENFVDERYEFNGGKLAHELMVDILGGLIPGALFLFSTILCVVAPLICYAEPSNNFGPLLKDSDWFWIVAFLSFLLLSYVIGHLFSRADIKVPDRFDIRREQKKKIIALFSGMPKNKSKACVHVLKLLKEEVTPLKLNFEEYFAKINKSYNSDKSDKNNKNPYSQDFKNSCENLENLINVVTKVLENATLEDSCIYYFPSINDNTLIDIESFDKELLSILFPELSTSIDKCKGLVSNSDISIDAVRTLLNFRKILPTCFSHFKGLNEKFILISRLIFSLRWRLINKIKINLESEAWIHSYTSRREFDHSSIETVYAINIHQFLENLIVGYLILHLQNESGCCTEERCDFPYISYYKYLLKRDKLELLKLVSWTTPSSRTKNQINDYKIELQTKVPNAYSIISRNESHIRMASSSWHVAK